MDTTRLLLFAAMAALAFPAAAADRIPVAGEGTLGARWSAVPGTLFAPAYPEAYAAGNEQVCVVIGYLLNADGHTSDFSLLKSWSSGSNARSRTDFWEAFAGDASRALSLWEFKARPGATPQPVYTAATFVFGPGNPAETKAHCAIPDLAQRLAELRYDSRAGRLMAGGIFSRLDIDPAVEMRRQRRATTQRENLDGTERGLNIVPELPHPPNHP
ncbi:MAG: hypothetical protein ACTHOC_10000 [Luteimonas sp.]